MAKSTPIELIPAGTILTTTGQGSSKPIPTITMLALGVETTLFSGSGATITIWLQALAGGIWKDISADLCLKSDASAAGQSTLGPKRNVVDVQTAVGKYSGIYKHTPWPHIRLAYVLGGTSPNVTLGAWLEGK